MYSTLYRGKALESIHGAIPALWQYYEQLPEIIKKEWRVDKKIYFLSKLYRTSCGTFVVDKLQALYRKMKY